MRTPERRVVAPPPPPSSAPPEVSLSATEGAGDWPQVRNFLTTFIKSREDPNEADYRLRHPAFHNPEADDTDARSARGVPPFHAVKRLEKSRRLTFLPNAVCFSTFQTKFSSCAQEKKEFPLCP